MTSSWSPSTWPTLARNRGQNGRIDQRHSRRGEPEHSAEAGSQRIRLRTHRPTMQRHRMATRHTHRRPHILHSRTLPMPRMRRRRRDTKRRMPVPGIRRIRKRLGMQRKASCTPSPRKAPRQAHSIWR